jgi:polysaccharide export outer membrane protein
MTLSPAAKKIGPIGVSLCLLFGAIGTNAYAQFSGPALTVSTTVNQTLSPTTDRAILFPVNREIRLFPGDQIAVHLFGSTDYNPIVRVSLDGSIQLPLIGKLQVKDLTIPEAEQLTADKLIAAGMYRNPQVTLQVMDSPNQVATVTGEGHAVVPIVGQRHLFDVLAAAGGLPPLASHTLTIHRTGLDQPIVVDLGNDPMKSELLNIPIFPGDTIVLSRAGAIYMLGAFKKVGAIPLQDNAPLTLMKAASLAEGPGWEGKWKDLRLIRTVGVERKVIPLNLKRILNGKDPDPILQSEDIVLLPSDAIKSAIKSGGLGTAVGFASILAVSLRTN